MEKVLDILTHLSDPSIISKYSEYLLLIVFISSFVEVVFPPIPGDTLLILSGSVCGYAGMSPLWVIVSSVFGTFSASWILYHLGRRMEKRILQSPRFSIYLDSKMYTKLENVLNRYGIWMLLISRFLPMARSAIVLVAGMVNLDRKTSMIALLCGILASTCVFVLGGRYLGKKVDMITALWNSGFKIVVFILAGLILGCLIVTKIWNYRKKYLESRE